jgi:hypothetical protein
MEYPRENTMPKEMNIGSLLFVKVKSVTRPVMKIEAKTVYFKVDGPIHKAAPMEGAKAQKDASGNVLPPPDLMFVTDLETGEEKTVVVNTVLGLELSKTYPEEKYVGKCFMVEKIAPAGNKRYATFQISEIALQETAPEKPATSKK